MSYSMFYIVIFLMYILITYSLKSYNIRKLFIRTKRFSIDNDDKNWGRPDIIPFDDKTSFAREDKLLQKDIEKEKEKEKAKEKEKEKRIPKDYNEMNKVKESKWEKKVNDNDNDNDNDNSNRGTGYNLWNKEDEEDQLEELEKRLLLKKENDEDDDNWLPSRPEDENDPIMRFIKNVLIDSPYDSARKLQAKYVVRNIFGFSLAIAIIFTVTWYAFPGKFISYKGDTDFSARYQGSISDTSDLLNQKFSDGMYFDDALGLPIKDPNARVPYDTNPEARAPPPSQEL